MPIPTHVTAEDFLPIDQALAKHDAEKIQPILDRYRLHDHDELKDFNRKKGEVIHSSRFIERLRRMNPRLHIQQQIMYPDDWGLYIQLRDKLAFICQISKGWMTEFSWMEVDARDLADTPHWGWRTVLLRLMSTGVFTWEQVVREFGHSQGANSDRWYIYTEPFRNRHSTGIIHHNLKARFD